MSDNRFVFEGLDELKEALRTLPAALAEDAASYVEASAHEAEQAIRQVYEAHEHTGNLAAHLSIATASSDYGASARIKNTAPHAWMFENGTQARHWAGGKGTGRMWGQTPQPPTHVFVRTLMKHRAQMYNRLRAVLERQGLEVTGSEP
jgi:hypothetical protein